MIKLGVVGLGPRWERYYAPAIRALANRVQLVTVYDSVHARALLEARDWACHPSESLQGVLQYPGLQAILLLDHDWYELWPCELASRAGKLTLLDSPATYTHEQLIRLSSVVKESDGLVMTAFPKRHHPLTVRLRELLATRLGPLHSLQIEFTTSHEEMPEELLAVIDWSTSVVRAFPREILQRPSGSGLPTGQRAQGPESSRNWTLGFGSGETSVNVKLNWCCGQPQEHPFDWVIQADCQLGQAYIDVQTLKWRLESESWQTEALMPEKTSEEMLLDLVCRRVLGGIVPITDLNDVLRGRDWQRIALGNRLET